MIVHLRVVPGFGVAVEEIRRPQLRSSPVILGGLPHQRGVVREASFEAQRRGVRAGMSLSQAHHQCPEGHFLMPDLPYYEAVWTSICDSLRQYTPLVEPLEPGQAVCDLSGCDRLWGGGLEAARTISAHIRHSTGIMPWLGVASNRLVAQLASTVMGAEGVTVVEPGHERAFLADLPLTLLPEIDTRLALTFHVLGLRTIGQFAALPAASVKERFGALGERLHRYAAGVDRRPVVPPPARPAIGARRECEEGSIEEAADLLRDLADTCAAELQRRTLAGTLIELSLDFGGTFALPLPIEPQRLGDHGENRRKGDLAPLPDPAGTEMGAHRSPQRRGASPAAAAPPSLPIPYRIHSMLPQPGEAPPTPRAGSNHTPAPLHSAPGSDLREIALGEISLGETSLPVRARTTVRTPVNTASRLLEIAHRLLLQHWPNNRAALQAIELRVSEFPAPRQLSFSELNRIGQVGGLAGPSQERLQALAEGEQVLAARYGDTSFRHVGQVDPGNILTERRFHWHSGLPWDTP